MNKNLFKNLFKPKEKKIVCTGGVDFTQIYYNPYIALIHDACSLCYKRSITNKEYDDKVIYVEKRAKSGHESILEHSNVINSYVFSTSYMKELSEVLLHCKYLNAKVEIVGDKVYLLLGGSVRGYKHIVRTIRNPENKIYRAILESMYAMHSSLFTDFIEADIMRKYEFQDEVLSYLELNKLNIEQLDKCSIQNLDPIYTILDTIQKLDLPFKKEDLLDMCTITIKMEKISRIITQQLTRHRVGITQLSQRYVNSTDSEFLSPDMFKPDKYDSNKKYDINIGSNTKSMTLQELGENLIDIYPQLYKQGLLKEDARAFLPNNTDSSLYMTFTFLGLIKFLELRTDKHAQAEVRILATGIESFFKSYIEEEEVSMYDYLKPSYEKIRSQNEYDAIDEVL